MVITINLPTGNVIDRLSTPPFVMLLGLSPDRRHMFAMRGRNTTRDWVTVIDTGFDADPPPCHSCALNGFDGNVYDIPGQFYYARVTYRR